jgi:hypothetical protein
MSPASGEAHAASLSLGPFEPPYAFGGSALLVFGRVRGVESTRAAPEGFSPLTGAGGQLGIIILSDYLEPPAELPLRYRELIMARLVRRRLTFAAQALDMVLDAELPVELGRRHYDLPKRYDAGLCVEDEGAAGSCTGADAALGWRERHALVQLLLLPFRLLVALLLVLFTTCSCVFGAGARPRRARIVLLPRALGRVVRVAPARLGGLVFSPLFALRFARIATRLGTPRAFD